MNHEEPLAALVRAAREARIESALLLECVERNLIPLREGVWDEEAIEAARRVRRLTTLGVNLQGVEVIFHMRRQQLQLQQEVERLHEEMRRLHERHVREVARLMQELAREAEW